MLKEKVIEKVIEAYAFAKKKHKGQHKKFSKLPYFVHPKAVARIVEDLTRDEELIIAALLHDTLEDTDATYREIKSLFGKGPADFVMELTSDKKECQKVGKAVYLSNKMVKMSSKALIVKLADRLNNVLFLERDQVPLSFIEKYFKETKYIMELLLLQRKDLDKIHKALIEMINAVLNFLQVRYKL